MYDVIVDLMFTYGITFDEALSYVLFITVALGGGLGYFLSMCLDLGSILWRFTRRLLRAALRPIRRRLKMHFQK